MGQPEHYKILINRFMRGIFNKRPSLPRYTTTWNPEVVLDMLKTWGPISELSLKLLSFKLATLALLLSGRRGQTIINISIKNIAFAGNEVRISLGDILKTSKKDLHEPELVYTAFPDKAICLVSTLREYLNRTHVIRGDECQLFISFNKPHKKISRDTLSRWIKEVLKRAGIDINRFKPHSLRTAATSLAASKTVSISTIMAAVGWRRESTFATFYKKRIDENTGVIGQVLVSPKQHD